ncbi:HAMP domain-containing sensor histidine kinase [Anaerolineales bacterium HSG25]|nr:HAMP domain-containing sensor histidine kinase [Anaerolineales bacterium HSG25]
MSFRWRLILSFAFVILFNTLLSSALTLLATTAGVDVLVTDQNRTQATSLAPLLEMSYLYHGNWRGLDYTPPKQTDSPTPVVLPLLWEGEFDRWEIVAQTLDLNHHQLYEKYYQTGSIAGVAKELNIDPNLVVHDLIQAERKLVGQAVTADKITQRQADELLGRLASKETDFVMNRSHVFAYEEWVSVVAETLVFDPDDLAVAYGAGDSWVKVVVDNHVAPETVVEAIIEFEEQRASELDITLDDETSKELAEAVNAWIFSQFPSAYQAMAKRDGEALSWINVGDNWLLNTILTRQGRYLLVGLNRQVLYDTEHRQVGARLTTEAVNKGVPLMDYTKNPPKKIGTLIATSTSGFYQIRPQAFLSRLWNAVLISSIVSMFVAMMTGWLLIKRLVAPVQALTSAARSLASGETATPLPVRFNDEFGEMSRAFNQMAVSLESQQTLRNRLVNDVAHDLKTPLSIIQLELEAAGDGMQSYAEAGDRVQQEARLLQNLVGDLSWLAQSDEGLLQLNSEPTNLVELTERAVDRWQSRARQIHVEIQFMPPAETLPEINADPRRLRQVLGNLLSNALQYTPEGGQIKITIIKEDNPKNKVTSLVTTVSNTGPPIDADDLPHLFERFYRTDKSRNKRTGGRGLGLSIVQQIVVLHGGEVWADSKPGELTCFVYRLPV